jgi:hypothetical protein
MKTLNAAFTTPYYGPPMGLDIGRTNILKSQTLSPVGCTIVNFRVELSVAPSLIPNSDCRREFTIMKDNVASTIICEISGGATTCDQVNSDTLALWDQISIRQIFHNDGICADPQPGDAYYSFECTIP